MSDKDLAEQKNSIDIATDAMYSLSFLEVITRVIGSNDADKISVKEFYERWLAEVKAPERKIPFSLGAFVGYLFCGLVVTKQNWSGLLPPVELPALDKEWGVQGVTFNSPKQPSPDFVYFVRRLRNSISHNNFTLILPKKEAVQGDANKFHELVKISFIDVNPSDGTDTFEATLSLKQLELLIKKFHSVVHTTLRNTPA